MVWKRKYSERQFSWWKFPEIRWEWPKYFELSLNMHKFQIIKMKNINLTICKLVIFTSVVIALSYVLTREKTDIHLTAQIPSTGLNTLLPSGFLSAHVEPLNISSIAYLSIAAHRSIPLWIQCTLLLKVASSKIMSSWFLEDDSEFTVFNHNHSH